MSRRAAPCALGLAAILGCSGLVSPTGAVDGALTVDGQPLRPVGCWEADGALHIALDDPQLVWRGLWVTPGGQVSLRPEKGGGYSAPDGRVEVGREPCGRLTRVGTSWEVEVDCQGPLQGLGWRGDHRLEPGEDGPEVVARGTLTARGCASRPPL